MKDTDFLNLYPIYVEDTWIFPSVPDVTETSDRYDFEEAFGFQQIGGAVGGVFQQIKVAIKGILNILKSIISWLGGLMGFKGKKTPDSILSSLGLNRKTSNNQSTTSEKIPASKDSKVKPIQPNENFYGFKSLICDFKSDGAVTFTKRDVIRASYDQSKHGKVKGHEGTTMAGEMYGNRIIRIISDDAQTESMIALLDQAIENVEKLILSDQNYLQSKSYHDIQIIRNQFNSFFVSLSGPQSGGTTCTVGNFKEFAAKMSEIDKKIIDIEKRVRSSNVPRSVEKHFIGIKTDTEKLLFSIQMGLNEVSKCFKGVYVIDKAYEGTINDIEVLGKFVDDMISSGIPAKYISFNVYMAASKELKGKGSALHPIWGQTRLVLFPDSMKDVVLKVAIGPAGRISNNSEATYYMRVKKTEYGKYFCPVKEMTANRCVEKMSRADCDRDGFRRRGSETPSSLANQLENIARDAARHIRGLPVLHDIHEFNIGFIGDQLVCIDYGM